MAFLTPDKVLTFSAGGKTLNIKQKLIPDNARATKYVANWCQKGQLMKPCARLSTDGKPKGITIHNSGEVSVAAGTTMAEQYTRATWPNCNMAGVVVHFYVHLTDIWQNLREDEQGWHAADGASRRAGHKGNAIGGNLDTIAIECIGADPVTEDTAARLTAYLCQKHGLNPSYDVYTHNWFMHSKDSTVPGARKNCPIYILPHWKSFLSSVESFYAMSAPVVPPVTPPVTPPQPSGALFRVQVGAFSSPENAKSLKAKIEARGFTTYVVKLNNLYKIQCGAFSQRPNADKMLQDLRAAGFEGFITTESGTPASLPDTAPTIKVGSRIRVRKGAKTYEGGNLATFVYTGTYYVRSIEGKRAVIAPAMTGAYTAAVNVSDLSLA